ncbi:MAG: metallophosphoesterase family protein [Rhodanobacteraceae bacterium]|nr:metallophosphoesterase family protein [Rhodanobacteraceae bacterium]
MTRARVLIVADTHGSVDARIAALARGCDLVVHGGDIGDAAVLGALGCAVVAVRGNNDVASKWPQQQRCLLDALPEQAEIDLPGGRLAVVHGDRWPTRGRHAALRRAFAAARAVVYGHSHRLLVDQELQPWLLNPGAAGRARTHGGPSCLLLEASAQEWCVVPQRYDGGYCAAI